ncbi:hypothetical protein [Denitromonas sp.]|uniref:ApeP family dehydratase n=1 Tax=Denitromonas sp. TaxID=2734609 RepID=UPI002AFE5F09|nr:hypothetical protein [Denitromonas sp.]
MNAFPTPEALLPHRAPNLLINGVTECTPEHVCAYADIAAGQWYSNADGSMPAWVGIELMAQAIAAFVGLEAQRKGRPPKIGYLLGTRAYRCTRADFAPGSRIGIKADLVFRDDSGLGAFDCTLHHDGRQIAEATLKVYETPDHD